MLKKIANWKAPDHDGIYSFLFNRYMSIDDRLTQQLHKCVQEANILEWMTDGKLPWSRKKWNHPNQQQINNRPTYVENLNRTDKRRNLLSTWLQRTSSRRKRCHKRTRGMCTVAWVETARSTSPKINTLKTSLNQQVFLFNGKSKNWKR